MLAVLYQSLLSFYRLFLIDLILSNWFLSVALVIVDSRVQFDCRRRVFGILLVM